MKIYCASDFNIGYEDANYSKIKEFFELVQANADELILCGDVLDLWRCPIETNESKEPMKSTYAALLKVAEKVQTTFIWGNHDYKLWKKVKIPLQVTDSFVSNNIYYCHGWRFYLQQMFGQWFYGWFVDKCPYLYQKLIKSPFELKIEDKNYRLRVDKIHEKAREFIDKEKLDYPMRKQESSSIRKSWIT